MCDSMFIAFLYVKRTVGKKPKKQAIPPENSERVFLFKIVESEFSASRYVDLSWMEKEVA